MILNQEKQKAIEWVSSITSLVNNLEEFLEEDVLENLAFYQIISREQITDILQDRSHLPASFIEKIQNTGYRLSYTNKGYKYIYKETYPFLNRMYDIFLALEAGIMLNGELSIMSGGVAAAYKSDLTDISFFLENKIYYPWETKTISWPKSENALFDLNMTLDTALHSFALTLYRSEQVEKLFESLNIKMVASKYFDCPSLYYEEADY